MMSALDFTLSAAARSSNPLGLGVVSKFLEGWAGAVIAKILVLVFIIIFIQKRPQGFSPSRAAS